MYTWTNIWKTILSNWNRSKRYVVQVSKTQIFQFCHFLQDIHLSFDRKSLDESVINRFRAEQMTNTSDVKTWYIVRRKSLSIQIAWMRRTTKFRICANYDCRMHQTSHEAKYQRKKTLRKITNCWVHHFTFRFADSFAR